MIEGYIEETLYLVGVEVDGDDSRDACCRQKVGDQLGADGDPRLVLAVLPCKTEIGYHGDDLLGGGSPRRIDEHEQLQQVVGRGLRALDDEHIVAADVILEGGLELTVGELRDDDIARLLTIDFTYLFGQIAAGPA